MSIDRSLENVSVVKLLIFALVFVGLCMFFVFALIIPDIKEYKSAKYNYASAQGALKKFQNTYDLKIKDLKDLEEKNKNILKAVKKDFNENKFVTFSAEFFQNPILEKTVSNYNDEGQIFDVYELGIRLEVENLNNFYNFLEVLNEYENLIKIGFPISIKKDENFLQLVLNFSVYKEVH